jgi:hypothetical protein
MKFWVQTIRQWGLPTLHLLVTSRNEMDIRLTLEPPSSQDIVYHFSLLLLTPPGLYSSVSLESLHGVISIVEAWTLHLLVTSRNEMDIRLTLEPPSSQDIVPGYLNEKSLLLLTPPGLYSSVSLESLHGVISIVEAWSHS